MNLFTRASRWFGRRNPERVEFPAAPARHAPDHPLFKLPPPRNDAVESILRERDQLRQQLKQATAKVEFTPGREFVCVLPFCAADEHRFRVLLEWIAELGRVSAKAILVSPASARNDSMLLRALDAFADVEQIQTAFDLPKEGWPVGANWSFLAAAEYCRRHNYDFWLNEPDAIPMRAGWFEAIRDEYRACGKPYMGFIEPGTGDYPRHLTGNAAYHHSVFHHFRADKLGVAWDIAMADVLTPLAHPTRLFHQEFGPLDHPPVFHTVDDLRRIPKEAVVFHRNKDGSLIRVLREQRRAQQEQKETEGTKA
jgi:hypothetical protein